MSSRLPTELQCLVLRMRVTAQELRQAAAQLPDVFAAATEWQTGLAEQPGLNGAAEDILDQARALEFDAQRLGYLADELVENDRAAYSYTMALVDACRMARGHSLAPSAPDADCHELALKLANTVEDGLADIQELLSKRFPGETIPGG